jgi:hypothetical protein
MNLEFSNKLLDWYWEHGFRRSDKYSLPLSNWVRELYESRDDLIAAASSSKDLKPAFAVWGPSQTGKSMLVSAYFDRMAVKNREAGEDGKNSALYWPGGLPGFFIMPDEFKNDPPSWINVLNPFRLGKDASACLSRFALGSLTPMPGRHHVKDPQHPIQLKLLNQTELLHVLGRGYDTECLGPHAGAATIWTVDEFRDRTEAVKRKFSAKPGPVSKDAVEMLLAVCRVLDSMVLAELIRYKPLVREGVENWESILAGLLDDPQFNANPELVELLAAEVLWDGATVLTDAFRKLKNAMRMFEQMWGHRAVYCDIQVAALFLDMDSVLVAFDGPPTSASPQSRDRQISDQIRQLRYKIDGDRILLGLSPSLPNLMNLSPEDYGHLQSLVLEMVIPLNPEFLEDKTNFKRFLEKSDLLDFPGVGNENNPKFTRIDLGFPNSPAATDVPTDVPPENRFPKYNPRLLFTRILKRGKTATIVSLYARQLKIDGFNIFLALDKNPPAKPGELNEGIDTWWKYSVPAFFKGSRNTKSPLPLNLVVLWWADLINAATPVQANYMTKVKWIYDPVGDISNPKVSNFFALNYYAIGRGIVHEANKDKLKPDSFFVRDITGEAEFKRVFGEAQTPGYQSFISMIEDEKTGGAEFYFNELCKQLESPVLRRDQILSGVTETARKKIGTLLVVKDLFPEPEERDVRRETLEAMQKEILEVLEESDERACSQINHLLREALNIDYRTLKPVPLFTHEISASFIRIQYASWITSQCNRVDTWRKNGCKEKPDWRLLDLDSREKLRCWLEALVASVEPHLLAISNWLKDLVEYNSVKQATDLRRVLAIHMGNLLVYGKSGPPSYDIDMSGTATFDIPLTDNKGNVLKGSACSSYKVFLQPFLEQQLDRLLNEGVEIMQRQEQPGDAELRDICQKHNCLPASAAAVPD